jgi:kumamolisin
MSRPEYRAVPGSARAVVPGSRVVAAVDPQARVEVTVVLRRATEQPGVGADPADVAAVEEFAGRHGLVVTEVNLAARSVGLAGPAADVADAFDVHLAVYEDDAGTRWRGRVGEVRMPAGIVDAVRAVLGLDDRPAASPQVRVAGPAAAVDIATVSGERIALPHAAVPGRYPIEYARWYGFPTDVTGKGQTVGIVQLGGGYRQADLDAYFTAQGLRPPTVIPVGVDGAENAPGDTADTEVALDMQVVGSVANGATIVVYFGPNTIRGFYDVLAAAVHDTVRRPSIVSISWGAPEPKWTAQALDSYDALFADAAAAGVSVFAACGDHGATDGVPGGGLHVDFPSSSPHAVGCGGTRLADGGAATGGAVPAGTAETVWNSLTTGGGATGGGVSAHFARPAYQTAVNVPAAGRDNAGRGVPDVAAVGDPATGYRIRVDGKDIVVGGTSAVSPLWAGLTALVNERSGRPSGSPHVRLYGAPGALRDIVTGDNGGYSAGPGWDPCTGLGVPAGESTVAALRAV